MIGLNSVEAGSADFDAQIYVRILIAIAKADKDNGPPEYAYVRRRARRLGVDYDHFLEITDKSFAIEKQKVSRMTALMIVKDAIVLASLDGNVSLPERQRVYAYAERLDIARQDVDQIETLIDAYRQLNNRWRQLVKAH